MSTKDVKQKVSGLVADVGFSISSAFFFLFFLMKAKESGLGILNNMH